MNCLVLIAYLAGDALGGVAYDEATLNDMADVIVEGEVTATRCLAQVIDRSSTVTNYSATVAVSSVLKGEAGVEVEIFSTVAEYTGEVQPACDDSGSIHPQGEVARFYLEDNEGTLVDFHWSGTTVLEEADENIAPECAADVIEGTACNQLGMRSTMLGLSPVLLVLLRRRESYFSVG